MADEENKDLREALPMIAAIMESSMAHTQDITNSVLVSAEARCRAISHGVRQALALVPERPDVWDLFDLTDRLHPALHPHGPKLDIWIKVVEQDYGFADHGVTTPEIHYPGAYA